MNKMDIQLHLRKAIAFIAPVGINIWRQELSAQVCMPFALGDRQGDSLLPPQGKALGTWHRGNFPEMLWGGHLDVHCTLRV